jgi:hypothetical protein
MYSSVDLSAIGGQYLHTGDRAHAMVMCATMTHHSNDPSHPRARGGSLNKVKTLISFVPLP